MSDHVKTLEAVKDRPELNEGGTIMAAVGDAIRAVLEDNERLRAITNSGHSDDCGGLDTAAGRCGCGWLQQEGAHAYITSLEENEKGEK